MSSTRSPKGFPEKPSAYEGFMGLDDSRDATAMETGREQHLITLDNGYADWRGQIVNDPPILKRAGDFPVSHARWVAPTLLSWAEVRGDGTHFNSDAGHTADPGWPQTANPSSVVFNRKALYLAQGLQPWLYDGTLWEPSVSKSLTLYRPAFAVAVQRRLCVAGMVGRGTIVDISRVDNQDIFSDEEPDDSENVLRAGYIDVGNLLGTADEITGLGTFEQNRLAIFTQDRCLIYKIDPDINEWQIEDRANIQIGCVSHNSIVQAGTDILFCSRSGVHSIRRSVDNGITVFSQPMSTKVERLYNSLISNVTDPQRITAVWDRDNNQYRIIFPLRTGEVRTLVMTLTTDEETMAAGRQGSTPKWSTASGFNVTTAATLGGLMALGTKGGTYDVLKQDATNGLNPEITFTTPIFWHGQMDGTKESTALIIQASGKGNMIVNAFDDEGRDLGSFNLEIEETDDDNQFPDVALRRQYQVKFERRYRGLQLRFQVKSKGLFRLSGFAVVLRK